MFEVTVWSFKEFLKSVEWTHSWWLYNMSQETNKAPVKQSSKHWITLQTVEKIVIFLSYQ